MGENTETRIRITAGAACQESQAFAEMLAAMYQQRALRNGHGWYRDGSDLVVVHRADYSFSEHEIGVHRLVRISPFDRQKRRHSSFVLVAVNGEQQDVLRRSYVLDPYKLVTDHVAGWKRDDVDDVLNGTVL